MITMMLINAPAKVPDGDISLKFLVLYAAANDDDDYEDDNDIGQKLLNCNMSSQNPLRFRRGKFLFLGLEVYLALPSSAALAFASVDARYAKASAGL